MIRGAGAAVLRAPLIATAIGTMLTASAAAADPSSAPTADGASRRSCAERYPADGPGGVDLQLGCAVNELVTTYTGGATVGTDPPRISAYLGPLVLVLAGVVALGLFATIVRRSAGRRLAPVAPTAFWSCPDCRSLNPAGSRSCYRCRRAWSPEATDVRTDGEAPPSQSFGTRHDGR